MPTTKFMRGALLAGLLVIAACGSDAASDDGAGALPEVVDPGSDTVPDSGPAAPTVETSTITVEGAVLPPLEDAVDGAIGLQAPVVTGTSFDQTPVTIGAPTGSPTMYVFLAHWCPHCNDEIPEINSLRDAGSLPEGFEIVGVSTAAVSDRDNYPPSEWMVDKDWTYPVLADSAELEAFTAFGGNSFPFSVIVDGGGTVLDRHAGSSPADDILERIIAAVGA